MRSLFIFFILIFFGCAPSYYNPTGLVDDPADMIARQFKKQRKKFFNKRIAIANFTDLNGSETPEAKLFTERLATSLATVEGLNIIERSQLEKLLKEQNFSHSGVVDSETAKKMGKILGVDVIVSGTVTRIGRHWEINCRAINVENGKILTGSRVKARAEAIRYIPEETPPQKLQPVKEYAPEKEPQKELIIIGGEGKADSGKVVLRQNELLSEANRHHRSAVRFKRQGRPRLALKEIEAERNILRRIIELNPATPPARKARERLGKLKQVLRRKLR